MLFSYLDFLLIYNTLLGDNLYKDLFALLFSLSHNYCFILAHNLHFCDLLPCGIQRRQPTTKFFGLILQLIFFLLQKALVPAKK